MSLALGLKDGNLGDIPGGKLKWAVFSLAALTGTWSIYKEDGTLSASLSHAVLYGIACPDTGCPQPPNSGSGEVPIPAAIWLLGSVIAGSAGVGRWRRKSR